LCKRFIRERDDGTKEVGAHVGDGGTRSIEVKKKQNKKNKKGELKKSKLFQL